MRRVKLIASTNKRPLDLASFSARVCYSSKVPKQKRILDVESVLWKTGHHTTFEHFYLSFLIEGIAVGDVTLGLHLSFPFYNSSQRSGRYAGKMFWQKSALKEIEEYLSFWQVEQVEAKKKEEIIDYVKKAVQVFQDNHLRIAGLSRDFLKKERPYISQENLEKWAPKIAQEQLRMFIPVIFPTALVYTIDLITLSTLSFVAWTPAMKWFVRKMVELVLKKFPETEFLFNKEIEKNTDWFPEIISSEGKIVTAPKLKLRKMVLLKDLSFPQKKDLGPLDLLQFKPELMNLHFARVEEEIEISLATMGQDQRHRTIKRGFPQFTGNFYLPPLLREAKMEKEAGEILERWFSLKKILPRTLWTILAPYGTMVRYEKSGDLLAIIHEQNKRTCWRAQEEIHWLACLLRKEIEKKVKDKKILKFFSPSCLERSCPEGKNCCGRNRKKTPFQRRIV